MTLQACPLVGITPREMRWLNLAHAVRVSGERETNAVNEMVDQMNFHALYMNERAFWDSLMQRQLYAMGIA